MMENALDPSCKGIQVNAFKPTWDGLGASSSPSNKINWGVPGYLHTTTFVGE